MVRRLLSVALAVTGAVAFTPSAAAAVRATTTPKANLVLTVTDDAGKLTSRTLACQPVGGTHPKAPTACADLRKVDGDPSRMTWPDGVACTMIFQPVTAAARGTWDGRQVRYEHTFGNACELSVTTGAVFGF